MVSDATAVKATCQLETRWRKPGVVAQPLWTAAALRLAAVVLGAFAATLTISSAEREDGAVDQRDFPDSINGCAPASVLNSLKFSDERYREIYGRLLGANDAVKMRYVVDRYFQGRPSSVYPGERRWGVHGVAADDLLLGMNDLLEEHDLPPWSGRYLDRLDDESPEEHVARVRDALERSLDRGAAPILSLRSFLVKRREERGGEPAWEIANHHNVVVLALVGPPSDIGIQLDAIDPFGGKRVRLFIHREGHQPYRALKGVEPGGKWLDGRPFLLAIAPDCSTLRPGHLEWSDRFIVIANYLVGDF